MSKHVEREPLASRRRNGGTSWPVLSWARRAALRKRHQAACWAAICLVAAAVLPSSASAIPLDIGGEIPPSKTPPASKPDPNCLESYADDAPKGGPRIRFGTGPRLAGESGSGQTVPAIPEDESKADAALKQLKGDRYFAVRLNRLFMSDGNAGIRQFKRLVRRYARLGLDVELQVRYHPADADNGNIHKWLRYVKKVVRKFGPNKHVSGLQITNEVNIGISPNTSDGYYARAPRALVRGVITADRESRRLGYDQLQIGFNYAWRFDLIGEENDAAFWRKIGRIGGKRLRKHTDWVGLDIYPGTWYPGAFRPTTIVDYGDTWLEGVAQTRQCFMPQAGFTRKTPLRIEETGYATGPGRSEDVQAMAVKEFVRTANRYRRTYNISDFRWFNLRDNNSDGPSFQQYFGLLRSDYTKKPAFDVYRKLVKRLGARR
jgi:hypothetical protein